MTHPITHSIPRIERYRRYIYIYMYMYISRVRTVDARLLTLLTPLPWSVDHDHNPQNIMASFFRDGPKKAVKKVTKGAPYYAIFLGFSLLPGTCVVVKVLTWMDNRDDGVDDDDDVDGA
jgi:hypothetical protein